MGENVACNNSAATTSAEDFEDALNFVDLVRRLVPPEDFAEFLGVLQEFRKQELQVLEVIRRVKALFRGKPELVTGFKSFLPPRYQETMDEEDVSSVESP